MIKCNFCLHEYQPNSTIILNENDTNIILCANCFNNFYYTCATCEHNIPCIFETDPDPSPKTIQKTFRRGPATFVQEMRNPERVDLICKKKCRCFSPDFGCFRENISKNCLNWEINNNILLKKI